MRHKINLLYLPVILLLSTFLRFYKVVDLMVFRFDQEHQYTLAMSIVKDFHVIWIGVSASNLNFYLGPGWVYFTSFWLFLSKGSPILPAYIASAIGVLTTLVIYGVGKNIFGLKVGLIAAFLYATLPLVVFFDRAYWNLTPIPLLAVLLFYGMYRLGKSDIWLIVLAGLYGLVFHTHLSLVFTGLIGIWCLLSSIRRCRSAVVILAIGVFIAVVSPLIVFDYFHKWSNITAFGRLAELSRGSSVQNLATHTTYFYEALGRLFYLRPSPIISDEAPFHCKVIYSVVPGIDPTTIHSTRTSPNYIFASIPFLILVWFMFAKRTWQDKGRKLLALFLLSIAGPFLVFHGGALEYYLVGFFPLFLYAIALWVTDLPFKLNRGAIVVVVILGVIGITRVVDADYTYSFRYKRQIIQAVTNYVGPDNFELQESGVCHDWEGWTYLFSVFGKRPVRSSVDKALGWVQGYERSDAQVKYRVVISEAAVPYTEAIEPVYVLEKGGFRVLIYPKI